MKAVLVTTTKSVPYSKPPFLAADELSQMSSQHEQW